MAVAQHHGRPHTPTDQAWIETLFGHVKGEWPHLERISDPALLEHELDRVRTEYNSVRLHAGIGYVTPNLTTSTKDGVRPSARPADGASIERAKNASITIVGTPPTPGSRASDLVHFQPDFRGKVRHTSPDRGLLGTDQGGAHGPSRPL